MKDKGVNVHRRDIATFFDSGPHGLTLHTSQEGAHQEKLRDVTGIILAGGRSSRFGSNKALADFGGVPLIERVLETLRILFEKNIIITNSPDEYRFLGLPLHEDIIKGLGPLGGIYSALSAMPTPWGFVTACDMPFIKPDLILRMASLRPGFEAVVPRRDWKIEPLHSLYSSVCLEPVKQMILSGSYQIIRLFESVKVRFMEACEIEPFDPDFRSFININRSMEMPSFSEQVER